MDRRVSLSDETYAEIHESIGVSKSIVDSIRPKTQTVPFPDINDSNFLLRLFFPSFPFFLFLFFFFSFFFLFFFLRFPSLQRFPRYRFSAISRRVKALLKNICVKFRYTSKCYVKFPELLDKLPDRQTDRQTDRQRETERERERERPSGLRDASRVVRSRAMEPSRESGVAPTPARAKQEIARATLRAPYRAEETRNTGSALRVHAGIIDSLEAEPFDYLDSSSGFHPRPGRLA